MNITVLISNTGQGTNLKAIIDAINSGKITATISAVISSSADALGLAHAKENNLPVEICTKKENLLPLLQKINPDYICLAGWKQIVTDNVINAFPDKILNLHPGLVPDAIDGVVLCPDGTPGLWNKGMLTEKAIQNFIDQKATYAGSAIHFLTLEFDFGSVLGRCFEKINADDTVETLYARLKQKENNLYVEVLTQLTSTKYENYETRKS